VTPSCSRALCDQAALLGSVFCRTHAPIAELREQRLNGEAALEQNGAEPQTFETPAEKARRAGAGRRWTTDTIVAAIQNWARDHQGEPPRQRDWVRAGENHPAFSSVMTRFESWGAALEAAGFGPARRGPRRRPAPAVRPTEARLETEHAEAAPDGRPVRPLGLTGDFAGDGARVRRHAERRRAQAAALETIAAALDELAELEAKP
jgi:Homing endonuclease associated repeat